MEGFERACRFEMRMVQLQQLLRHWLEDVAKARRALHGVDARVAKVLARNARRHCGDNAVRRVPRESIREVVAAALLSALRAR